RKTDFATLARARHDQRKVIIAIVLLLLEQSDGRRIACARREAEDEIAIGGHLAVGKRDFRARVPLTDDEDMVAFADDRPERKPGLDGHRERHRIDLADL